MSNFDESLPVFTNGQCATPLIAMNANGHFMVEGIEEWINKLISVETVGDDVNRPVMLKMVDPKTEALYLIRRLK